MNDLKSITAARSRPRHPTWTRLALHLVAPIIIGAILAGCATRTSTSDNAADSATKAEDAEPSAVTVVDASVTTSAVTVVDASVTTSTATVVDGDDAVVDNKFPDVIAAEATRDDDGSWTFAVTISSPYDSPDRYADAWRVSGLDGEVYGVRELAHDHASEQPFTRSKSGIQIPDGVTEVTVLGRDQLNGWGGAAITVVLP